MGFAIMIVGVALWWAGHFFKRAMPGRRAAMGDAGKGVVALVLVAGIAAMVIGFRAAPVIDLWYPPASMRHLNNLAVLVAIFLLSPAGQKGRVLNSLRHPMLTGIGLWAIAHLLVNGDLAAIVLFGGLLFWALAEVAVINRTEPGWTPSPPGSLARDAMFLVASIVLFAVIGYIHGWLGPPAYPT